jgi:hypothetical protein
VHQETVCLLSSEEKIDRSAGALHGPEEKVSGQEVTSSCINLAIKRHFGTGILVLGRKTPHYKRRILIGIRSLQEMLT